MFELIKIVNGKKYNRYSKRWRLCLVSENLRENMREKEKWKKIKNRFKINKLFLYVYSNSFHLVSSII